jgi:hypothetical protein
VRAGVGLVEIELHTRGFLARRAPPEDEPARRVDFLDETGSIARTHLARLA